MKVLVTGATGFVGGPVLRALAAHGHDIVAAIRRPAALAVETRLVGDLGPDTDWRAALAGCDAVIHLAARAHVMHDDAGDPLALFRRINRDGAERLALQAAEAGIRRMVFVSTIKVNGEATPPDRPFRAEDRPAPQDPYGIAKAEAEDRLRDVAARTGLELVIVRPPLVHGPGAKGNLAVLLKVLSKRLPLPLGAVTNRRSLVGVANLADALAFLVTAPIAGGTFLIRDGMDVSTAELLRLIGKGLDRPACLLPVPPTWLRATGHLLGKAAAIDRLLGSLVVDDTPLRQLGWTPPVSLADGLAAMAASHRRA
jgi:nucleoside-diphosphate-sugar epimerase